jgi:hypothetical protein
MKKLIATAVMVVTASVSSWAGPLINWGSDYAFTFSGAPDCLDRFGSAIPKTSNWAVELIRADTGVTLFTAPAPGGASGFWELYATDGVGFAGIDGATPGLDGWNGLMVFTRVWDLPTPGIPASNWHADTPATLLTWIIAPPTTVLNYNFGEVTAPMWVPEPGTGLLVLAGAAVAIFRRRRQQD